MRSTTPAGKSIAGQKSKPTNGAAQRNQSAAPTGAAKNGGQRSEPKTGASEPKGKIPASAEIDPEKRGMIERLIEALKYWLENKPDKFPFWARLKIGKQRTTLIIDEAEAYDKKKKKTVDGYVDREATHTPSKNTEEIKPNPDRTDKKPMHLKRPQKRPKDLYKPHNKKLDMPDDLKKRYEGNNKKK